MTKLIERNTTIPSSKSQVFSTASDSQSSVEIHVLQGEREFARDNRTLGKFHLDGIAPAPRGMPQIEVTFDIDANGILNVKAKDKGTNKEQTIRIESSSGLSKEEVERMRRDAEAHAAEDKERRELIDAKNQADQLVHETDKQLNEHGSKLAPADRQAIESARDELKTASQGDSKDTIQRAIANLQTQSQKLGQAIYQQQQQASGAGAGQGGAPGGGASGGDGSSAGRPSSAQSDEAVDADFEVKA
jgi:molecular chaperone DnaK